MSKIRLTDRALRAAAAEYRDAMLAAMPEPEVAEFEPSPRYKANIARLLRKMERKERLHRYVRRAAAAVLVFVLGSGAFIGLNGEVRADFLAWLRITYENSVIYRYTGYESNAPLPQCELTWLPEGYELLNSERDEDYLSMMYENGENDVFVFSCYRITEYEHLQMMPAGKGNTKSISINGLSGDIYYDTDGSNNNELVWYSSDNSFIFILDSSNLEKAVIVHIAENIKITN